VSDARALSLGLGGVVLAAAAAYSLILVPTKTAIPDETGVAVAWMFTAPALAGVAAVWVFSLGSLVSSRLRARMLGWAGITVVLVLAYATIVTVSFGILLALLLHGND
jgi:hypothetical protein